MIELYTGVRREVTHLAFSPDSRVLAASSHILVAMDIFTKEIIAKQPAKYSFRYDPHCLCFHKEDSTSLLLLYQSSGITTYHLHTRRISVEDPIQVILAAAYQNSSGRLVVFDNTEEGRWLGIQLGDPIRRLWAQNCYRSSCVAIFPTVERWVHFDFGGGFRNPPSLVLRSMADGSIEDRIETDIRSRIAEVCVSPRSDVIVARQEKGSQLFLWRVSDLGRKPEVILNEDRKRAFTDIAFHPSGRFLAVTSNDATVKLYDSTTWEVARTFTWDIGKMRSIAFSPDGTLAAAGSDTGKVVVWDVDL